MRMSATVSKESYKLSWTEEFASFLVFFQAMTFLKKIVSLYSFT